MSSNLVTLLYQLSSQATSQPSQMTAWSPSHQLTAAAFGSTHSRTDSFYPELQYFLRLTPSMMIADVDLRDTMCVCIRGRGNMSLKSFYFYKSCFGKFQTFMEGDRIVPWTSGSPSSSNSLPAHGQSWVFLFVCFYLYPSQMIWKLYMLPYVFPKDRDSLKKRATTLDHWKLINRIRYFESVPWFLLSTVS